MSEKSDDSGKSSAKTRKRSSSLLSEEEHAEPPAFSLASLGLQRVGTKPPPKPQPAAPKQLLNARGMPARIRKKNRFFFDDNIINDDKPLRMSLSPRKMPLKPTGPAPPTPPHHSMQHRSPKGSPPLSGKSKILKKRKPVAIRFMRPDDLKRKEGSPRSSGSMPGTPKSSGRSQAKHGGGSPSTSRGGEVGSSLEKAISQQIGMRLRNLLKLPKAHKWVIYEWFYSFIDRPLFEGENEFQVCLRESFPHLKTRQLTRAEWRKVRSLMGKPRRSSPAFFQEERRELECQRKKVRFLQTQRHSEIRSLSFLSDLPDKIPLPLPIGTKVTARLRVPQDGIFSGTVDAYDSLSSQYRVSFDRPGLGTHQVPDFEIVSENFHEKLTLQSITRDFRPSLMTMFGLDRNSLSGTASASGGHPGAGIGGSLHGVRSALKMNLNKSDPLLGQEVIDSPYSNPVLLRENIKGYPVKLLETMLRLRRVLAVKQVKLQRLREMNDEAELRLSEQTAETTRRGITEDGHVVAEQSAQLSEEFQRRYASLVISLEKMNEDIQRYVGEVQSISPEVVRDSPMQAMIAPTYLREKCREGAESAVLRNNHTGVEKKNLIQLIKNLTTVLMVTTHLKSGQNAAHVAKVLEGCIEEVKSALHSDNVETFQKHVQIHLHHINSIFGQQQQLDK